MDSVNKILDAIYTEGRTAADEILENGRDEAEKIRAFYEKEAQEAENRIMDAAAMSVEEICQRGLSQAGIESRNISLTARRNVLKKAFDKALAIMAGMPDKQKKEIYEILIAKHSTGKEISVQLNEKDKRVVGNKLKAEGIKVRTESNTGDFAGGLIIRENTTEVNCTFEAMVDNARRNMEAKAAEILFS